MASSTDNVKLGVCNIYFDGIDLGYTKGGVEVSVSTETHDVNIDQFGKTAVSQLVMGRSVKVKVPLAETTLENMAAIMPGATITQTGGAVASATATFATTASANNDTFVVNGVTFTFKTVPVAGVNTDVALGTTFTESAANLLAALQASTDPKVAIAQYSLAGAVITIKYGSDVMYPAGKQGLAGNLFTLTKTGTNCTLTGAGFLAGGTDPTSTSITATSGVNTNLLTLAKELRLHQKGVALSDKSEDFVVFKAGTGGALTFAYKLDDERIYNVEFSGFPDTANGDRLFGIGV